MKDWGYLREYISMLRGPIGARDADYTIYDGVRELQYIRRGGVTLETSGFRCRAVPRRASVERGLCGSRSVGGVHCRGAAAASRVGQAEARDRETTGLAPGYNGPDYTMYRGDCVRRHRRGLCYWAAPA